MPNARPATATSTPNMISPCSERFAVWVARPTTTDSRPAIRVSALTTASVMTSRTLPAVTLSERTGQPSHYRTCTATDTDRPAGEECHVTYESRLAWSHRELPLVT